MTVVKWWEKPWHAYRFPSHLHFPVILVLVSTVQWILLDLLKIIHLMSALCSKEYLMWNIIHFCIEISSAVWKLASGEFYFKKKCKWKREEPESKHHSHKRITTSSWRVQYIQKIVLYPDEWSLFTLQKNYIQTRKNKSPGISKACTEFFFYLRFSRTVWTWFSLWHLRRHWKHSTVKSLSFICSWMHLDTLLFLLTSG